MKYVDVDVRSIIEKAQGNNLFAIIQAINKELELEALSESESESASLVAEGVENEEK